MRNVVELARRQGRGLKVITGCYISSMPILKHLQSADGSCARLFVRRALLLFFVSVAVTSTVATGTGRVTGNVSAQGKAMAAMLVVAMSSGSGQKKSALTNAEGNYSINLSPGSYLLSVVDSTYVLDDGGFGCKLAETKNDSSLTIDFSLTKGGVISGAVSDALGQPLVGGHVFFEIAEKSFAQPCLIAGQDDLLTDDQGEFRIIGLPTGVYRIGIGGAEHRDIGKPLGPFRKTYYPGVSKRDSAKAIELLAGQEAKLPKFSALTSAETFSAEIKSLDDDTGEALPGIEFDVAIMVNGFAVNKTQLRTEAEGTVHVSNLDPGQYKVLSAVRNGETATRNCSPTSFEIVDRDLKDIIVRCSGTGVSLSGKVTINETSAATDFDCAIALKEGSDLLGRESPTYAVRLGPRGLFTINGLRRTTYMLVILPLKPSLEYEYAQIDGQLFNDRQAFGKLTLDLRTAPKSIVINLIQK